MVTTLGAGAPSPRSRRWCSRSLRNQPQDLAATLRPRASAEQALTGTRLLTPPIPSSHRACFLDLQKHPAGCPPPSPACEPSCRRLAVCTTSRSSSMPRRGSSWRRSRRAPWCSGCRTRRSRSASAMEMALERQDKNGGKTPFRRPWVFGSMFSDADNLADDADGDDVLLLARKAATRSKTPTSKSRSARQGRKTSTRSVTPVSRLPLQDTPTGRLRRPTSDTLEEPISRDAIKLSSEKAKKEHHRAQKRQAKHAH